MTLEPLSTERRDHCAREDLLALSAVVRPRPRVRCAVGIHVWRTPTW